MKRVALAIALAALPLAGLTTPAGAQSPAADQRCDRMSVLLLLDTSASLKQTDPSNQRIDAAKTFVDSMSTTGVPTDLTVGGFSEAVTPDPLPKFSLPGDASAAKQDIEQYRAQTDGVNTDYVLALLEASNHFGAITGPAACKTLVWFTDGAYDIEKVTDGTKRYTSTTSPNQIVDEFAGQVCGPKPATSQLSATVSEEIRQAGFIVDLIDLRVSNEDTRTRLRRQQTNQVLDRLLSKTPNSCSVPGSRVQVSQAGQLGDEFWKQGQSAAGRSPIDCAVLARGMPVGLLRSVAVRAKSPSTELVLTVVGTAPEKATGALDRTFADNERAQAALASVKANGGAANLCYASVDATAELIGKAQVYGPAKAASLGFVVKGPGDVNRPELSLSDEWLTVEATVAGQPAQARWDEASRRWVVDVPGGPFTTPFSITFTPRTTAVAGTGGLLRPNRTDIAVVQEPPMPTVRWLGPSYLEGKAEVSTNLKVESGLEGVEGTMCVTFPTTDVPLLTEDGRTVGHLTVDAATPRCGADGQIDDVPARVVVDKASNDGAAATLHYTASFGPDATSLEPLANGAASEALLPAFTMAKLADTGKQTLVAAALVLASSLLTLALLWLFTRWQSRLPDPDQFVLAPIAVGADSAGAFQRAPDDALHMADLRPLRGSRRRFQLTPALSVRRWTSLNPFARIAAEAVAEDGVVAAAPSHGQFRAGHRRLRIPSRFQQLLVVHTNAQSEPEAVAVVRRGATPAEVDRLVASQLPQINQLLRRTGATANPEEHVEAPTTPRPAPPSAVPASARPKAGHGNGDEPASAPVAPQSDRPKRQPPPPPPKRPPS